MNPGLRIQRVLAVVAMLFGGVTIFASGRVLLGADPGYVVFRPLLVFNAVMGWAYVGAGIAAWRSVVAGRQVAAAIFALNLFVLVAIGALYMAGDARVAIQSVLAMTLRTLVWLALLAGFAWLGRRSGTAGRG